MLSLLSGHFGVFWGFWTLCAFVPFAVLLYGLYPNSNTTLDLLAIPGKFGKNAYEIDPEDVSHEVPPKLHERANTGMSYIHNENGG